MMKNVVQKIQKIPFLFMLVLVFFTCISASAQIQVKGTVVSANDSEPMIGVAILEEGTSNGRITDLNGNYSIQVKAWQQPMLPLPFKVKPQVFKY